MSSEKKTDEAQAREDTVKEAVKELHETLDEVRDEAGAARNEAADLVSDLRLRPVRSFVRRRVARRLRNE
jgi:hypothetical protein